VHFAEKTGMETSTEAFERLTIDEALAELQTDRERGLTSAEAGQRLKRYGFNEIPEGTESFVHRVVRRFWGPIPWMIEAAALLSALVGKWEDFSIIMVLLLTNVGIDFWQESKALSALAILKEKLAKTALVLRDGAFRRLDARELVPGDLVKVRIGDLVPADLKLIAGDYLQSDQSSLTGESLPVGKKAGEIAYANSIVKQGEMVGVVTNTALNTFFGKTVALVARAEREKRSHFQRAVIHIGNYLILITLFLVAVILITAMFRHEPMLEILRFALVLTVAAIPVAMPAILSVTMAVGALNLAKRQAIVSRLVAIEELAGVDVLCSDKTGTLTQNRMTVADPVPFGGRTTEELLLFAALASREENQDPIEIPIFEALRRSPAAERLGRYRQERFTPFDPVGKRTEAVVAAGEERFTVTKGAPQVILEFCAGTVGRQAVLGPVEALAAGGYRTLGVAIKEEGRKAFTFIGLIPLFDPPREDSEETIREAKALGLDVKMVTGDNLAIARHIARVLAIGDNIRDARELSGDNTHAELAVLGEVIARAIYRQLTPEASAEAAEAFARGVVAALEGEGERLTLSQGCVRSHESEIIGIIENAAGFAQVFPEDKYLIVEKLQKAGHIVGMTGDGVNDAPALKKADAGIAVSGATDAARAAADLVLLAPGLSVIVEAIKGARITFERMKSYSIYRIAETIRLILFMTASILIFNFYPVTAIMIIILAFLNDIPILAIAFDNTKANARPIRWEMPEILSVATVLGVLGVMASFGIFYLAQVFLHLSAPAVQSFVFLKLAVAGHLTIFVTRTEGPFWRRPYPAPLLLGSALATKLLATLFAVYGWFVAPIGWENALLVWVYALVWFVVNDSIKIWVYRFLHRAKAAA
jgi:H+-transporting ATPase